jgi:hypothetical protein
MPAIQSDKVLLRKSVSGMLGTLMRTPKLYHLARRNGEPNSTAFRERLRLFYLEGVRKLIGT